MRKLLMTVAMAAVCLLVQAQETLNRAPVAVKTSKGVLVSWRSLSGDGDLGFNVYRDGVRLNAEPITTKTNYLDADGVAGATYRIESAYGETAETKAWDNMYTTLKINRPPATKDASGALTGRYRPDEISIGDVDADGEFELVVKWLPDNQRDSGKDGKASPTYLSCHKMDGTQLWRICLGHNIRSGNHTMTFLVYDFDGDGKAEMICKTATGSKDGLGNYVNQAATDATILAHSNTKDYRNSGGHILSGPEYLTVFEGLTGKAIHTTWYLPGRAGTGAYLPSGNKASTGEGGSELGKVSDFPSGFWGDNYGGRSERFLGAVAYVNGADQRPCGIFCRGYYTKAYVWAVSFDGTRLHSEWLHASSSPTISQVYTTRFAETATYPKITVDGDVLMRMPVKTAGSNTGGVKSTDSNGGIAGSNTLYSNGNHNLSIADVDGDGCDEIIWGAGALNNDGTLLYATGYGHGDAIHVGKMIPDSTDLYVFDVHEEKLSAAHGSWDLHNARTGRVIWHGSQADKDNGRGMAAALYPSLRGYQFWSSDERNPRSATGGSVVINKSCSVNFRIYWDGSYQDQLFDGSYKYDSSLGDDAVWEQSSHAEPFIEKWGGSSFSNVIKFYSSTYNNAQTANYTKSTPCLQADILGDWREELVMWNKQDSAQIMIFSTWTPTNYAVPTLMHDHVYRMGVAWQNTAYNQPPHLGYYLPDYIDGKLPNSIEGVSTVTPQAKQEVFDLQGRRLPYSSTEHLPRGLYVIKQGNHTYKLNR